MICSVQWDQEGRGEPLYRDALHLKPRKTQLRLDGQLQVVTGVALVCDERRHFEGRSAADDENHVSFLHPTDRRGISSFAIKPLVDVVRIDEDDAIGVTGSDSAGGRCDDPVQYTYMYMYSKKCVYGSAGKHCIGQASTK